MAGNSGDAAGTGAAVARAARRWEELRGAVRRGETGPAGLTRGLREISGAVTDLAAAGDRAAAQLAYRVDLLRCRLCDPADAVWALDALPRLWHLHRTDAASYPAHPDAVGAAVPPVDGDGEPLPEVWPSVWRDVAVTAAGDPAVSVAALDAFGRQAQEALTRSGDGAAAAKTAVDILLVTARVDEAQRLLDRMPPPGMPGLSDPPQWEEVAGVQRDLDQRAMVALLRGDATGAAGYLADMEALPEAGGLPTLMQAEALIPLAATGPAADTARRAAAVAQRCIGLPSAATALLQVTGYLARAGEARAALGLLERSWPVLQLRHHRPVTEPHVVETLAGIFADADAAGLGTARLPWAGLSPVTDWLADEVRPLAAGAEPTVAELAEATGRLSRRAVAALDARNTAAPGAATRAETGRLWDAEVPPADPDLTGQLPFAATPPLHSGIVGGLPDWADPAWFELPAEVGRWTADAVPEIPPLGPVDLTTLSAADLFTATVLYSLLGMADAVALAAPRLADLAGDPVLGPACAELADRIRHSTGASGGGEDTEDREDREDTAGTAEIPVIADLDRMLEVRVGAQEDARRGAELSDAPARDILAARVAAVLEIRDGLHPLIRHLVDLDVLLGGVLPDITALRPALAALPTAVRLIPRAVPQLGVGLLTGYSDITDGAVDDRSFDLRIHIAVGHLVTGVALCLPPEPPATAGHPDRGGDQVSDLLLLSRCLGGGGMLHEALALLDRGLDLLDAGAPDPGCDQGRDQGGDQGGDNVSDLLRLQLMTDRFPLLADLGNDRAAAAAAGMTAESAAHRGDLRTALYCRTMQVAALLDDGAFPAAAAVLARIHDHGPDPARFPHENYLLRVQEACLSAALTDTWFADEWPDRRTGLAEAWDGYRAAALVADGEEPGTGPDAGTAAGALAGATAEAVRGILRINHRLVRAGRIDEALDLVSWGATTVTRGGVLQPHLDILTEQALLLHVAGRDDEALLIFESVVQQARRAGLGSVVAAVLQRAEAASRLAEDPVLRRRYADFVASVTGTAD